MKPIKHNDIPNATTDLDMFLTYLNKNKIAYSKYDIVSNIGDIICVVWENKKEDYYVDIFAGENYYDIFTNGKRIETTFPNAGCYSMDIDSLTELLLSLDYL